MNTGFLQFLIKEHFVSESTLWANHLRPKIQGKLYWYFLAISPLCRCIFRTRARNNSLIRRLNQLSEMFLSEVVCFVCGSVTEVEGKSTKSGKTFPHILIGTYLTIFHLVPSVLSTSSTWSSVIILIIWSTNLRGWCNCARQRSVDFQEMSWYCTCSGTESSTSSGFSILRCTNQCGHFSGY